jgi:Transposase DDE domain
MDSGWLDILSRLPADLDLNQLARENKAIQRLRGITDAADLLRLGLARGPGGKTLKETAAWAGMCGIAEITAPSLSDRLHGSVAFFSALTTHLLADGRRPTPAVWRGRCLHLCDASNLSERGGTGTDWRIHATFQLASPAIRRGTRAFRIAWSGRFSHLELTDGKGAEALRRAVCDDGGVMIADRGYAKAGEMATFRTGSGGRPRDFIVRTGWNMLRLEKAGGKPFDLPGMLRQMQQDPGPDPLNEPREWVLDAQYGRGKRIKRLPIRLLILPVSPDKAEIARKKLRRSASKRQHQVDPNSELAAGFVMLATSLPPDIPTAEICAVYRLRWQIEFAFKRLKSLLKIDRLPTWTEAGSLSWLYLHLIFALLTDDICQDILESPPSGPR